MDKLHQTSPSSSQSILHSRGVSTKKISIRNRIQIAQQRTRNICNTQTQLPSILATFRSNQPNGGHKRKNNITYCIVLRRKTQQRFFNKSFFLYFFPAIFLSIATVLATTLSIFLLCLREIIFILRVYVSGFHAYPDNDNDFGLFPAPSNGDYISTSYSICPLSRRLPLHTCTNIQLSKLG